MKKNSEYIEKILSNCLFNSPAFYVKLLNPDLYKPRTK